MGTGIPLLNEYKQEFFWKRLPQTVLGGPKLRLGYDAPFYVYLNQVLLFVIPFLIGGIFTLLVEVNAMLDYVAVIVYGCLITVFVLSAQITTTVGQLKMPQSVPYPTKKKNLLAEEDEVDFESCCGVETMEFVVPKKKFRINILLHAFISGPMCGLTLWYLLPRTLNNLYYYNVGATVVLYIFGWFTLCVAQYPLTVGAPPEPAAYRTSDSWELSPLMRPFYVYICITFDLLYRYVSTVFLTTDQALHIVFACLTLIWTCGLLPPLDTFMLWLLEQVHVFLLGGSPMASNVRVLCLVTLSVGVYLAAYFIPASLGTVLVCSCMGYILSLDLGGLGSQLYLLIRTRNKVSNDEQGAVTVGRATGFLWKWGILEILYHFIMLAIVGVLSGLLNYNSNSFGSDTWKGLGYTIIGLCVIEKILRDTQNVYIVFGLWRNMLFPSSAAVISRSFLNRKRKLQILGILRRFLTNFVSPLIMLSYVSILITSTNPTNVSATSSLSTYTSVWYTFGIVRVFRWIWQGTVHSLLELSITHAILVALPTNTTVIEFGVPVLSLIIGLCRDRFFQFLNKLYFFVTVLISSWTDKKQRRGSTAVTILLCLIFFPVVVGILAAAAAISAPLLPLFTLPLFFIAFPRPTKFWPEPVGASANVNADTMFYKQFAPKLSQLLRTGFANGSLGEPNPGNHYLVRFQDRLVWVMILERGNGYCTVNIKGLELQETSCHTAEALRLDDILEVAFGLDEKAPCLGKFNPYPMHTLTPVDAANVMTYSDARNVLTGIIDNPDAHQMVMNSFIKSLVWVFLHHVNKLKIKENKSKENINKNGSVLKKNEKVELEEINHNGETANNNVGNKSKTQPVDAVVIVPKKKHEDLIVVRETRPPTSRSVKRKSSWSSDLSLSDSIFSDDGLFGTKDKKKQNSKKEITNDKSRNNLSPDLFGGPITTKSKNMGDEIDDLIDDLDFGLPATDVMQPKLAPQISSFGKTPVKRQTFGNSIYKPVTNLAGSPDFKCPYSMHISLPPKWRELPVEYSQLSRFLGQFPKDWYKYVLDTLDWSSAGQSSQKVSTEVAEDDTLMNCYAQLIMACYSIFDSQGSSYNSANYLYKCYIGDIPFNAMLDWLSEDKELLKLVLRSYRYGFKMMIDQLLLGEMTSHMELQECLEEYDRDWYIGLETDEEWKSSVLESRPNIFSLGFNKSQGTYSSRLLSLQDVMVHVGRLNSEAVRGQWANLSLELIYLTNDDEERYSIQAHPVILRNLTVQAADPPLGYPIFSSEPLSIPTI